MKKALASLAMVAVGVTVIIAFRMGWSDPWPWVTLMIAVLLSGTYFLFPPNGGNGVGTGSGPERAFFEGDDVPPSKK